MTAHDLHDLLDRAGDRAPVVDASAIARQAQADAVRRHRRQVVALAGVAVVAVVVAAGTYTQLDDRQKSEAGSPSAVIQPGAPRNGGFYSFTSPTPTTWTCCTAADVAQAVHPGGTFTVHFVPYQLGASNAIGESQVLRVTLTGPYPDVITLKAHALHDKAALSSAPLSVTTGDTQTPVSTIAIPPAAATGFYNLTTSDTSDGSSWGGGSIIEITK